MDSTYLQYIFVYLFLGITQASVWIQPLNDLRWPNTWEEMMTTPWRTSEAANHQQLYWINQILP